MTIQGVDLHWICAGAAPFFLKYVIYPAGGSVVVANGTYIKMSMRTGEALSSCFFGSSRRRFFASIDKRNYNVPVATPIPAGKGVIVLWKCFMPS